MIRTLTALVALVVMFNVTSAQVFTVDRDSTNLRTIDPNTAATVSTTPIAGAVGIGFLGLTCDPITGELYAIENLGGFLRCLVAIDPFTGVATFIGPLPNGTSDLAFDSLGLLYGIEGEGTLGGRLSCIDVLTGTATTLVSLPSFLDGEALDVDPFGNDTLYRIDRSDLVSIDPTNFAETFIGSLTGAGIDEVRGIGFDAFGDMLAVEFTTNPVAAQRLWAVTITGATTFIGNLDHGASGIVEVGLFAPPVAPVYPGTNEDLVTTWSRNNGVPIPVVGGTDLFDLLPGETFAIHHLSPGGTFVFDGEVAALGSVLPTGSVFPTVTPGLHLDLNTVFLTVTSSVAGQPFNLPPQGVSYGGTYLGGLAGTTVLIQCAIITGNAANLNFASTNAVEIDLL